MGPPARKRVRPVRGRGEAGRRSDLRSTAQPNTIEEASRSHRGKGFEADGSFLPDTVAHRVSAV